MLLITVKTQTECRAYLWIILVLREVVEVCEVGCAAAQRVEVAQPD